MHIDGAVRVRGERTRAAILDAAERLFADRGYANTRLADVAEQVGIRRASIVYYFRDKRELYEAVLDDAFASLVAHHTRTLDSDMAVTQKLERLAGELVTYGEARPTAFRLVLQEIAAGPALASPLIGKLFEPIAGSLQTAMAKGAARGEHLDRTPYDILMTVVGAMMYRFFAPPVVSPALAAPVSIDAVRDDLITIIRALAGTRRLRPVRKV